MALNGDWRDTRAVLEAALLKVDWVVPPSGNLAQRDWDIAEAMLKAYRSLAQRTCAECRKPIDFQADIVCLDCGAPLHKECAPRHFWPNGKDGAAVYNHHADKILGERDTTISRLRAALDVAEGIVAEYRKSIWDGQNIRGKLDAEGHELIDPIDAALDAIRKAKNYEEG